MRVAHEAFGLNHVSDSLVVIPGDGESEVPRRVFGESSI